VTGFAFWLMCLARLPLGYAYPVACSSIVIVALLGVVFLGEAITPRMLGGTLLIVLGVWLVTPRQ
jgi:drug/metabolite transporter (DMT)-like permease